MQIRFRCPSCNQMLGIAGRKAGSQIECPTCGVAQRVPTEIPPAIDVGPRSPAGTDRGASEVAAVVGKPVPSGMILFRRRTLYVHGMLFLVLGLAGFGLGYLVGRGDVRYERETDEEAAAKQQIALEGEVVYLAEQDRRAGDKDAVIIALPEGPPLGKPFSIQGIRPHDPPSTESETTLRRMRDFGGDYARADELGKFSLSLPNRGTYYVAIISAHVKRPPRSDIEGSDQVAMSKYFTAPELLIGRYKYRWLSKEVHSGSRSIDCDFRGDEK